MTNTMKSTTFILCLSALFFAACNDKEDDVANEKSSAPRKSGDRVLLATDLPPELIEGTPKPIRLPGYPRPHIAQPSPVPATPTLRRTPPRTPQTLANLAMEHWARPAPRQAGTVGSNGAWNRHAPPIDRERYGQLVDNAWQTPADAPLSTFSVDVDTASYSNLRRMILSGAPVPRDAVRMEEMVNYFDYSYAPPTGEHPFAVHVANAACPWNPDHQLVRVALKGREIARTERPPANLVFLLDVSGSMSSPDKLPLVVDSFHLLLEEMNASDTLAIVVYAGAEGLALPPTRCNATGRERIAASLDRLQAGGSTNGGAGIGLAYQIAREQFKPGGINRVILATDGDFNVGVTGTGGLVRLVERNAESNVFLTVLGFGGGNLNDGMLEAITNKGNGVYHYIDTRREARRVFLRKLMGTLVTIAKDVKIQIEFNPDQVRRYRLLGYANRMLRKEDFSNDRIDAGDIGSGHTVTAFYEIETGGGRHSAPAETLRYRRNTPDVPEEAASLRPVSREWLTVKLRYKQPDGDQSTLLENPFVGSPRSLDAADADFRFATSVALSGLLLRGTEGTEGCGFEDVVRIASGALGADAHGQRAEFLQLVRLLGTRSPHRCDGETR